jgi:hypothetical protein
MSPPRTGTGIWTAGHALALPLGLTAARSVTMGVVQSPE